MDIKGTTRVCGLIGNPVEHSVSPLIHNTLAKLCKIDLAYVTFRVEQERVCEAVRGAYALNILGMNVTVPHKQSVMQSLAAVDPLAEAIGAVNTLVRTKDGFAGYNTDIIGLERQLADAGICLNEKDVVILGAGGASRAIAFLCADKGAAHIYLLNRTLEKAQDIADAVNRYFQKKVVIPMHLSEYQKMVCRDYLAIQTTSVGLHPNDEDVIIDDAAFYEKAAAGVDIIYNPAVTRFMRQMEAAGKPAFNGLKMLLYQGVAAFELWNGCAVSQQQTDIVYETLQKELGIIG